MLSILYLDKTPRWCLRLLLINAIAREHFDLPVPAPIRVEDDLAGLVGERIKQCEHRRGERLHTLRASTSATISRSFSRCRAGTALFPCCHRDTVGRVTPTLRAISAHGTSWPYSHQNRSSAVSIGQWASPVNF